MATFLFSMMVEANCNIQRGSSLKYTYLIYFIIRGLERRTSMHSSNSIRESRCNQGNAMIILFMNGQGATIRNYVPCGCRSRGRTSRAMVGGHELYAELMCVTLIPPVMFLGMGELVTLVTFGCHRSSRVLFLEVLLLIVELVDLRSGRVKSFPIRGQVCGTRRLYQMMANINISTRILRFKGVKHFVNRRWERHQKMACFGLI